MATYSHGYKKQTAEQTLLKVIVGIIVSVFIIVGIAFGFNKLTEWKSYSHYPSISDYASILNNSSAGDNYVVYLYNSSSSTCPICSQIKNEVLKVGNEIDKANANTFFVADIKAFSTSDTAAKATFLTDTKQIEVLTPSIIVVANGQFYAAYSGDKDVLSTLNAIKDGTFAPFN